MKIIQMQFVPQENTQNMGVSGKMETFKSPPLLFGLGDDGNIYQQSISTKNPYKKVWTLYITTDFI